MMALPPPPTSLASSRSSSGREFFSGFFFCCLAPGCLPPGAAAPAAGCPSCPFFFWVRGASFLLGGAARRADLPLHLLFAPRWCLHRISCYRNTRDCFLYSSCVSELQCQPSSGAGSTCSGAAPGYTYYCPTTYTAPSSTYNPYIPSPDTQIAPNHDIDPACALGVLADIFSSVMLSGGVAAAAGLKLSETTCNACADTCPIGRPAGTTCTISKVGARSEEEEGQGQAGESQAKGPHACTRRQWCLFYGVAAAGCC